MHADDHVFGSLCMYRMRDVTRADKGSPLAQPGVWVGRSLDTGGHKVVPISWDSDEKRWVLHKVEVCKTVHVRDGN